MAENCPFFVVFGQMLTGINHLVCDDHSWYFLWDTRYVSALIALILVQVGEKSGASRQSIDNWLYAMEVFHENAKQDRRWPLA